MMFQKECTGYLCSYFALEHRKKTRTSLSMTGLLKYIAFFEFDLLKQTGKPPLNLKYRALERGPVVDTLYNAIRNKPNYENEYIKTSKIKGDQDRFIIYSKIKKIDFDYFSDLEIEEMRRLIEIFADRFVSASIMSDASHEEILAWRIAWKNKEPFINMDYTFNQGNFDSLVLERYNGFHAEQRMLTST